MRLLDGDGAYAHYLYAGGLADQPAYDMKIFDVIRHKWVELRNEELKADG